MNYSIGEFSKIARVTVKALRLYHEKEILIPDFVDPSSGYRYYSADQINEARVIQTLKEMGFSLAEIKSVLDECEEDKDLIARLHVKKAQLEKRIVNFKKSVAEIELLLSKEEKSAMKEEPSSRIEEKLIEDMLVAGHRMIGRYDEIGKGFGIVGRHAGRFSKGKVMCLYYDDEYKEEGADFEPCFEVTKDIDHPEITCHTLEGGPALCLTHKGPYNRLTESYTTLFETIKAEGLKVRTPSREVYIKGPGLILRGNPEKYLTEIQILVEKD